MIARVTPTEIHSVTQSVADRRFENFAPLSDNFTTSTRIAQCECGVMSATEVKKCDSSDAKKFQGNNLNPSYTVRVVCCVFFIFLTEICLSHYVYRLINSEIRSEFVSKSDFRQFFINELRSAGGRDEILRVLEEFKFGERKNNTREKRNANKHGTNYLPMAPKDIIEIVGNDDEKTSTTGQDGIWLTSTSKIAVSGKEAKLEVTDSLQNFQFSGLFTFE